uniref:Uncharacterized protein n=1 Tax=Tetranychus urticae TaxID=32264 RepID=T1KP72_TETUR
MFGIVFGVLAFLVGAIGAADNITEAQRDILITNAVIFGLALLCSGFIVVLLGSYTAELANNSYA